MERSTVCLYVFAKVLISVIHKAQTPTASRRLCQKREDAILRDNDSCWVVITNRLIGRKDYKTIYYTCLYDGFKWKNHHLGHLRMKIAHAHHVLWTVSPFGRIVAPYRAPL